MNQQQQDPIAASLAADIARHCAEFEKSDAYGEMIRKHVSCLYENAIADAFRWGDFPAAVKKALASSLPANISEIADLPRYNLLMAKALAEQWEADAVGSQLVKQMRDLVLEFVKNDQTPEFIKASDLWDAYIEENAEEALHSGWEAPQVIEEHDDRGFYSIGLCKEPDTSSRFSRPKDKPYQCETYLGFHQVTDKDRKPVQHDGHQIYTLFAGQLEYSDVLGKKAVQFRSKFEKLVGALYYGHSKLILDVNGEDIYYPNRY